MSITRALWEILELVVLVVGGVLMLSILWAVVAWRSRRSGLGAVTLRTRQGDQVRLRVVCAWCDREMSAGDEPTSHGLCGWCASRIGRGVTGAR